MRRWLRSNWAAGAQGKRQVILASLLFAMVLAGISGATWCYARCPLRYRAVLEGTDQHGHYFTTLAVASPNRWQASCLALRAAQRQGLHIVRLAEIEAMRPAPPPGSARVLRAPWEKTYFSDDDECENRR